MRTALVLACLLLAPAAFAGAPPKAEPKAEKAPAQAADKEVSLKGEVIDTVCYLSKGAKGAKHKECAQACLKQGVPASLLSEGKLYMLLPEHGHEAVMEQVKAKGGEEVTVTGKAVTKDGMSAILITALQ